MSEILFTDASDPGPPSRPPPADCVTQPHFDFAMKTALDRVGLVHDAQRDMPAQIERAVAAGIRSAVADPALWEAAGQAMRSQAQSAAGGWLLGGVRSVVTRVAWIVAVVAAVYALGGWGAVVALLKASSTGGH